MNKKDKKKEAVETVLRWTREGKIGYNEVPRPYLTLDGKKSSKKEPVGICEGCFWDAMICLEEGVELTRAGCGDRPATVSEVRKRLNGIFNK